LLCFPICDFSLLDRHVFELAMMRFTFFSVLLASPMLVAAGMFSRDSGVTMLDDKAFRQVMKEEVRKSFRPRKLRGLIPFARKRLL
jgi:hypothetical protein